MTSWSKLPIALLFAALLAPAGGAFAQNSESETPGQPGPELLQQDSGDGQPDAEEAAAGETAETVEEPSGGQAERKQAVQQYVDGIRDLDPNLPVQQDTGFLEDPWTWMPQEASAQADAVDFAWTYILWVCVIFTIIVFAAMIYFVFKYRARSDDEPDPEHSPSHSTTLEITWTVIPTCIVLVMFALGFKGFLGDTISPPNAYKINVIGGSWYWNFEYPNGVVLEHLHLPVDRPVQFTLKSQDVIHSFYVPAFRMKKDVVPGRFNTTWTTPTEVGIYDLFCAEYCGQLHSQMGAKVFVHEQEDFDRVLNKLSDPFTTPDGKPVPYDEVGQKLYAGRGCSGCHSVNGAAGTGPSWRDLYGAPDHQMSDGSIVVVDDAYIRESIYYPQRKIRAGYGNAMASYLGVLSEKEVQAIIAYQKTISQYAEQGDETAPAPQGGEVEAADIDPDQAEAEEGEAQGS